MIEYIEKYARVDRSENEENSVAGGDEVTTYSDAEFIDEDEEINDQEQSSTNYHLMNVTRNLQEALFDQSTSANLGECSDLENLVSDHVEKIEYDFDTFDNLKKKKIKKQQLKIFEQDSNDSFYIAILYATFSALLEKKEDFEFCQDERKLTRVLGQSFFERLTGRGKVFS